MESDLSNLEAIARYRLNNPEAHLLVDTNILLLFLVGLYDREYLKNCSLLKDNGKNYNETHFDLMYKILDIFLHRIVITPQVSSEIYSLSHTHIKSPRFQEYFSNVVKKIEKFGEHHIKLDILSKNNVIIDFGFTDISLVECAKEKSWVILTDELKLKQTFGGVLPIVYFGNIVTHDLILV